MRIRFLGHYLYAPVLVLALIEALAILFAHFVALRFVHGTAGQGRLLCASGLLVTACAILSLVTMGLYCQRLRDRIDGIVLRVSAGLFASGFVARLLSLILLDHWIPGPVLAVTLTLSWLLLLATRLFAQHLMDGELFKRRVLVLGSGRRAARVLQLRRRADRRGFRIVGFVAMGGDETAVPSEHLVGMPDSLIEYARAHAIREIVVAMDDRRRNFPFRALLDCRIAGIGVCELGSFLERETGKVFLDTVDPSWLIFGGGFRHSLLRRLFDRTFDLVASALILLAGSPLMLLAIVAIKMEDGFAAPVLYTQERVGQHGRVFNVMKFRSMRLDAEQDGHARWAQAHDSRVTRVGSFIRMTRLDEFPQLLNVLRGTMSFVGPRPERPTFVAHLGEEIPFYGERHSVKPGITGWAQLCYPYGASDRDALEKLQYDLFYVKNRGLMFDMMILLQTVEVILFGKGAR
jgi:sugar transferase (PEP-CTERM system associated)